MQTNEDMGKSLKMARILQVALIVSVLIFAALLYWALPSAEYKPVFAPGESMLNILTAVLGALALYNVANGLFFLPRRLLKTAPETATPSVLLAVNILSGGFFESVGIIGLILGMLGAEAVVTVPFLVVSLSMLVLTFPTTERWRRMAAPRNTRSGPE